MFRPAVVDPDAPSIEVGGETISRAERDRRLHHMRLRLAYRFSDAMVRAMCTVDVTQGGDWYDTSNLQPDLDAEHRPQLHEAMQYLELARLLLRHPAYPHLVRVKEHP